MADKFFQDPGPAAPLKSGPDQTPSLGLALGSEGIMAFSALPLIEFLQENNVRVDLVAATSGGSLLAALWGSGYDMAAIRDLFTQAVDRKFYNEMDYTALLNLADLNLGPFHVGSGLLRTTALQRTYQRIFEHARVEDLNPRTVLMGTDLLTGSGLVMETGDLARAVYASGCIYPMMPPAKVEGRLVADGAMTAPLPIMELVKRNMDVIVAVYFDAAPNPEPASFMQSLSSTDRIMRRAVLTNQIPLSIEMHHYEIVPMVIRHPQPMDLWEVDRIPEILHAGRKAVRESGGRILDVVRQYRPELLHPPRLAQGADGAPRKTAASPAKPEPEAVPKPEKPAPRPTKVKVKIAKKGTP